MSHPGRIAPTATSHDFGNPDDLSLRGPSPLDAPIRCSAVAGRLRSHPWELLHGHGPANTLVDSIPATRVHPLGAPIDVAAEVLLAELARYALEAHHRHGRRGAPADQLVDGTFAPRVAGLVRPAQDLHARQRAILGEPGRRAISPRRGEASAARPARSGSGRSPAAPG
jgi:hypothetical protein